MTAAPPRTFWVKLVPFDDEDEKTTGKPPLAKDFINQIQAKEFTEPRPGEWRNLGHLLAAVKADSELIADVAAVGGRLVWSSAEILFTDGQMDTVSKEVRATHHGLPKDPTSTMVFLRVRFVPTAAVTSGAAAGVALEVEDDVLGVLVPFKTMSLQCAATRSPKLGAKSPSEAAETVSRHVIEVPCHAHYAAVECAKVLHALTQGTFDSSTPVLGVKVPSLPEVSAHAANIVEFLAAWKGQRRPFYDRHESALTAFVALEIDRALFRGPDCKLAVLHQWTLKGSSDDMKTVPRCDFAIVHKEKGTISNLRAVGDAKISDIDSARKESMAYSCTYFDRTEDKTIQLCVSYSQAAFKVGLMIPSTERDLYVTLGDFGASSSANLTIFLKLLFVVAHILDGAVNLAGVVSHPQPSLACTFDHIAFHDRKSPFHERVFSSTRADGGGVWITKYYDLAHSAWNRPNVHLIKEHLGVEYLPGLRHEVVVEGRLEMVEYSLRGQHRARWAVQFKRLFADLSRLHEANLVHGDVREVNVIFWEKEARLIDFDWLSADTYPDTLSSLPAERHAAATAGSKKRMEHDLYSLGVVMENYRAGEHNREWDSIVTALKLGRAPTWDKCLDEAGLVYISVK